MGLDELPLQRDREGGLVMAGHGPCNLRIDYSSVLAREDEGVTFMGFVDGVDGRLIKQVRGTTINNKLLLRFVGSYTKSAVSVSI